MPAKDRRSAPKQGRRRPGRPRKPRSELEAEVQAADAANAVRRRHISSKQRAFISRYVDGGMRDPYAAAKDVGFTRLSDADKLPTKLADLIEAESLRRSMGQQMEIDEALTLVAELARGADDPKTKHSALRTVLEVHGVLTGKAVVDRREQMRSIHQLVAAIREKIEKGGGGKGGGKVRVRAVERTRTLEAEIGGEEEGEVDTSDAHIPLEGETT